MVRVPVQQTCTFRAALFLATLVLGICLSAISSLAETPPAALPSSQIAPEHLEQYSRLAVEWLQQYLRIDTTNPPGNELRAAEFFRKILEVEGIEARVFEYQSGRADLWARLLHTTAVPKRPIILLNHMDVVTSDARHWKAPPFSGEVMDGSIYGRGAQDMKSEGIAQLMAMIMVKREKVALDRDLIFLAVSDEEADGSGTNWMITHQRDLLGNAEFLINEGGENLVEDGKLGYIGVDVGEKIPFWLHVVAHGRAGHGSRPIADSAPNRLVRALNRILADHTPYKLLPVVQESLREMAPYETPERARRFRNLPEALQDPAFQEQVDHDESLNFLVRDTISLTMMGAAGQTNVIPAEAWANLDVRLLPGEDKQQFLETIRRIVNDPNITVEPEPGEFGEANYSPTDSALYRAIRRVTTSYFPQVPVVPRLTSGYTESQRYRPLGIQAYGFTPYTATDAEGSTEHGNDERIRLEEVRRGPRVLFDVVLTVAGPQ